MEIFVPGRLCILGEHSDWAAMHRRQNSNIEKGYAIVAQTNQGNRAIIKKIDEPILRFISPEKKVFEIELEIDKLLNCAREGRFFSYIAGTAYQLCLSYKKIGGIEINNYFSDLPLKKGLSSSASICVLVARAFNKLFNLGLTTRREMELAYLGEITTPSRCGKLDQVCAYDKPVLMIFDAEEIEIKEIDIKEKLYFVIVDLKGKKDTKKILSALNIGYPFPVTKSDIEKHSVLGEKNKMLVLQAVECLKTGDLKTFGEIMKKSQDLFDQFLSPYCLEELTSPMLHKIINYGKIQPLMFGAKGVGSQGDGTAQILAKNKKSQEEIIETLEKDFGVMCFKLNV